MVKKLDEENFYKHFGSRLKTLRKNNKITQTELAYHLGIKQTTLVNYENANRKIPLYIAVKIAGYFNVSLDSIISNNLQADSEFKHIIFTENETNEINEYVKYVLHKRNDN